MLTVFHCARCEEADSVALWVKVTEGPGRGYDFLLLQSTVHVIAMSFVEFIADSGSSFPI